MTCDLRPLLLLALAGCVTATDGLTVDVSARVEGAPAGLEGWVGLGDAALVRCDTVAWWDPITTAYAHGGTVDTAVAATPIPADGTDVFLTTLTPAPGRYCGLDVALTGADGPLSWTVHVPGWSSPLHGAGHATLTLAFDTPLVLDVHDRTAEVVVALDASHWLDALTGMDAWSPDAAVRLQGRLLDDVEATWR